MEADAYQELIDDTRSHVEEIGCTQLRSVDDVDAWLDDQSGRAIVFFNSMCGCAGASARPGLELAKDRLEAELVTLFAGIDREATARMRERTADFPPSSPAFLVFKDGSPVGLFERERILGQDPRDVADQLVAFVKERS